MTNRADPLGFEDTLPAEIMPLAILRGDGPYLDRFDPVLTGSGIIPLPVSMKRTPNGIISRYSIGPVIVSLPFVAPQLAILDRLDPGWDRHVRRAVLRSQRMTKVACACITALLALALHRLLLGLGVGAVAIPATLAAAMGSDLWVVASQAPWEHGTASLMLTLSMWALTPAPLSRRRLILGGATTGFMVCCRSTDLVFALAILFRIAWERPRALLWFLPMPLILGTALLAYNMRFFSTPLGGLAELEALHPVIHGVDGSWSGSLLDGMAGTLFSPNRGLFVFSPWILVSLLRLPVLFRRIREWSLGPWLAGAIVLNSLILSKYSVWWGGHSFGPRYWTDAIPIFAVIFAFSMEWAWARCRPVFVIQIASILVAITFQAIGAFCSPSSWSAAPVDVDRMPSRLWDWRDNEIARCLSDGVKPWWTVVDPFWRKSP
jgi:hypothetical protein